MLASRSMPSAVDKAQEPFVPRHRDAQRDDHRRLGERLAVQHEGHNVLPGEVPLLEFAEFRPSSTRTSALTAPPITTLATLLCGKTCELRVVLLSALVPAR